MKGGIRKKVMQKILEALANDALRVEADEKQRTPEHQRVSDLCSKLEDRMEARLEGEDKKLFDEMMSAFTYESSYYAQERFIRGFRLGALIIMEIFADPDVFLWRGMDS